MTAKTAPTERIKGVLERIIFFNEENNYCIAELDEEGKKEKTVVVGQLPGVQCGETLEVAGRWTRHPAHGPQFKVESFRSELPASVHGIRKYLGSGLVKGVSKGLADRVVAAFGEDTLRVISEESARLQEVDGIGRQRARSIKEAWDAQVALREVMVFLQTYGVSVSQCLRLVKQYGERTRALLETDPYRVAREVSGIGFKTADRIAINMGMANDGSARVEAGLEYALESLQDEGHTAFPARELVDRAAAMLEVDRDLVREGLKRLFDAKRIRRVDTPDGTAYAQLPYNRLAERRIAQAVRRLQDAPSGLPPIKFGAAADWAQKQVGFAFSETQRQAVIQALQSKLFVITGGPGTGKTTILQSVVAILKAKKARVLLAAPTGRAAQRMAESAGASAQTIHRLLKFDPAKGAFTVNEDKPLNVDVLVVDEASMLDVRLAASLFQAAPSHAHLILVGDVDQLPSVGPGNVLQDLVSARALPSVKLDVVFRQGKRSGIVAAAHAINRGQVSMPAPVDRPADLDPAQDLLFVAAETQEEAADKILQTLQTYVRGALGMDPLEQAQVLAPMRKGVAGVDRLNARLQDALNPQTQALPYGAVRFKPGDKVMQTRNNYDKGVFNGDIGAVVAIDGVNGCLDAEFDGERHTYDKADLLDLSLAYAVSIHKSQGSEYPVAVLSLLKAHYMMLRRNLLYTAITRGKLKTVIVGDPAAYAMAVRNAESAERQTLLKAWLTGQCADVE